MCFGRPSAPVIQYQGPDPKDVERQNQQLQLYMQQSAQQQEQFATSLQQQIDQANAAAEAQRRQLDQERQAAAASMAAQQQSGYAAATATQTDPIGAQVTETVQPKKNPRNSLRIAPGSVASAAGTGINIGV
jgi:hypothetical protein